VEGQREQAIAEQLSPAARQAVREILRVLEQEDCPVRVVDVVIPAEYQQEAAKECP